MTLFGIRQPEIHFIIYIWEQNEQREKLNMINKDWDHIVQPRSHVAEGLAETHVLI